jgi:hypothetical protein
MKTVCNLKNMEHVRNAVLVIPKYSAVILNIFDRTVCHILHQHLSFHLYKIQLVDQLNTEDTVTRQQFCQKFLEFFMLTIFLKSVTVLRQRSFPFARLLNKQNTRYSSHQNPCQLLLHSEKVTVSC